MDAAEAMRLRLWTAGLAAFALMAGVAAMAAPADAASGQGTAAMVLAEHDRGRTLSGQGVKVLAGAPASKSERTLSLPISSVDPGADPSAGSEGSLSFTRGKRAIDLTGLRFNIGASTLSGKLGGEQLDVFKLGAAASVNSAKGSIGLDAGKLRLTPEAGQALRQKLGLPRALRRDGVGMVWLAAQANPTHEAAKSVLSGAADWGVLASWRAYVLGQQGPPMSKGSITVEGGATANGTLSEASGFFGFPATGGSFQKGLYGAADELVLQTQGSVKFAKPFHCIVEVKLADLEVRIDGANSSIALDSDYDIDIPEGMTCNPQPPVTTGDVTFAALNLSGVSPTHSADGKTVTWTAIPATLTAAGATAFGTGHKAGLQLDPVTITVGLG
jgi:Htaa